MMRICPKLYAVTPARLSVISHGKTEHLSVKNRPGGSDVKFYCVLRTKINRSLSDFVSVSVAFEFVQTMSFLLVLRASALSRVWSCSKTANKNTCTQIRCPCNNLFDVQPRILQ